ncbi:MAG: TonB-dependent receptor [Candidatus Obscuribacterales bacterium]|nr:TonB-dependent receptor [Steroidobacteraceae bacterium]
MATSAQAPELKLAASGIKQLDEVVVFGRNEELIGKAPAASEGTVGGADLSVRPLLRVAELLEVVPGLIAAQHSGSGKANQYFLRGFNLDHGTDFTTYIDDVPLNLRSHGHGQGYLDVNGLIPEVIDRIDYRKGTYRADVGDFSMAGSALMSTVNTMDTFVAAESGQYGWMRFAGGGGIPLGDGQLLLVGQWKSYDGPWELPEDLKHQSAWAKYAQATSFGNFEISLSGYHATWQPSEQIPENAIRTNVCEDEYCSLDPTATGETERWIASARWFGEQWRASLYGQYYNWDMISNPTYDADAQIKQFDRRWIAGGRYEREFNIAPNVELTTGAEFRYDDIGKVGLDSTAAGVFVEPIGHHEITEGSAAVYSEAAWNPVEKLRVLGGVRADVYDFDVRAVGLGQGGESQEQGEETDSAVSPKLGLAYKFNNRVETYANWGRGFHSNDARGVVDDDTPIAGIGKGKGQEIGARFAFGTVKITTTYWWLELDSELKFVGDSNSVEPGSGTRRRGYELVGFWRPIDWLALDAVWTGCHARYVNNPDGEFVAGAVQHAGELGISAIRNKWEASMRVRHLGSYPLIEDNSVRRAEPETHVNIRAAWHPGNFTLYGELLNVLDEHGKDIVYFYETNVPGRGVEEGRVSRAEEPRTVRAGVKYRF